MTSPAETDAIGVLGAYFCLNMILITLSTFLSVVVINLYFRGDKKNRVPKWLKRVSPVTFLTFPALYFSFLAYGRRTCQTALYAKRSC